MATQSLCIHGHFYQPPREDPRWGTIPAEVGAAPYRNWNERIHAECYAPNAKLGNFERLSFNVGPTLFGWMEHHDPATYGQILEQDRANLLRYGVGNAMAQAYNHTILPLATRADKETQIRWGIADFRHRFGRAPQGMWLPEAGVDNETLSVMAAHGIDFTILAPWQADTWDLDPTEPYTVELPDGRSIVAFFYHRDLSGRVSFDAALTSNADTFAINDLRRHFQNEKASRDEPQLLLVASDGELYGHHQPFRDYFLAHLLKNASAQIGITPTYPARWLREHPPRRTIRIRDNTSWSCHHGVVRWLGNCDCAGGQGAWKWPLRFALDQLAARLDHLYDDALRPLVADPWELRNRSIEVVLGERTLDDLVDEMAGRGLDRAATERVGWLLDMQRERQRMFTSCGWFFDDFDRIEPKNNVAYAAQAVRLARRATGIDLTAETSAALQNVVSWRSGLRGDQVFDQHIHALDA